MKTLVLTLATLLTIFVSYVKPLTRFDTYLVEGSYTQPLILRNVTLATEYVVLYPISHTKNSFRVKAWSDNATPDFPLLIVVKQTKSVTSWQVPMVIESSEKENLIFSNTSKTMCHDSMENITSVREFRKNITRVHAGGIWVGPEVTQSFILSLSTSSSKNLHVHIELEEEKNFYIVPNRNYSLDISPSQPRFVFYRFGNNSADTVVVEIDSVDDVCLTVSVQDSKCPVLDSNKDIKYEGRYQTINRKGATTIKRKDFLDGFFLVFVAKPDNYECSQESSIIPIPRATEIFTINNSTVTFKVYNGISMRDYLVACLGTFLVLSVFGIIFTVLVILFNRFGTISQLKSNDARLTLTVRPFSDDEITEILHSTNPTVDTLAKNPAKIKKRSFNYLAHTFSIALFYGIPVVQLVVTYQRVVNQTGDQDMCYYNFKCAHPAMVFSDFNHIYSNIGYIITGIFFIFAVIDRQTRVKIAVCEGIPVHYGLFYSMGVALIIEGILSACYHICPSQSNYQFDTSFMYIMAVLIMVKLFQNRHPDINASAYSTFTIVGLAIFMAMIGILNGSLVIWSLFIVCYAILVVVLSFKIYFFSFVMTGVKEMRTEVLQNGFSIGLIKPIRKSQFITLALANIVNYTMLAMGIVLYIQQVTDFGTFLLGLLLGNTVIHLVFYTVMKIVHGEKICWEAILFGTVGMATWITSGIFFLDAATLWTVTPAESRQWNQGCILINFFDKHDVWHLLSAPALYFTFLYLMYLDDDVANKKQSEIPVF